MAISIAEYAARVIRLRIVLPDLESDYNDDEGLTLVWNDGARRNVLCGETDIVLEAEKAAIAQLRKATDAFNAPVEPTPFNTPKLRK